MVWVTKITVGHDGQGGPTEHSVNGAGNQNHCGAWLTGWANGVIIVDVVRTRPAL